MTTLANIISALSDVSGMTKDSTSLYILGTYQGNYGVHRFNISNLNSVTAQANWIPYTKIKGFGVTISTDTNSWPYRSLCVDNNYLYIIFGGFRVIRFILNGTYSGLIDNDISIPPQEPLGGTFSNHFGGADNNNSVGGALYGISVDSTHNMLYVSASDRSKIVKINLSSMQYEKTEISTDGTPAGSVVVNDYLYCVDTDFQKIYSYGPLSNNPQLNLNAFPNVPIGNNGGKSAYIITSDGSSLYVGNDSTSTGCITKINLSNGSYIQLTPATKTIYGLVVFGTNIYASLNSYGMFTTITYIPSTPIYLGNANVNGLGGFDFNNSVLTTGHFPQAQNELVPRAYVDSYIGSVISYYNKILDPSGNFVDASGNPMTVLDRIAYLEAQMERVYQAWWSVSRTVATINTPHSGSLSLDLTVSSADNNALIANAPTAPNSLSGFT